MKKKIAVIGSGIAGLTIANLFKQNLNFEIVVYEKEKILSLEEGYGIQLAPNSISILKKIGEESAELLIASKEENTDEQIHEIVDLWFHILVLMVDKEISLECTLQELKNRFGKSGLQEKAMRKNNNQPTL